MAPFGINGNNGGNVRNVPVSQEMAVNTTSQGKRGLLGNYPKLDYLVKTEGR